jgi:hypothetical protein
MFPAFLECFLPEPRGIFRVFNVGVVVC